ncbi:MAG: coenzyme F420-0:L-glutamate ligase [Micromonosporaceae bacterium]|nr:coenzyme F420-0:L-glutamate ligase [Micromonosporaceae bacterium]
MVSGSLQILPVTGIGRIQPGDDLVAIIGEAAPWLRDGDVLVVTSKIVSKAEGRLVEVPADGPEREAARAAAVQAETARVVAQRGATRIVATHHGFVMAAAGIDASNVDRNRLVLLPKDPDASARAIRAGLAERYGRTVAVVISDTMGRPWRLGLTDVALGAAGLAPLQDHRGQVDPYGNELQLTVTAVVDELAAAADLVKGKLDEVPVAVVRGYPGVAPIDAPGGDGPGAVALVRDSASDLFSLGTAEARAAGMAEVARLPIYAPFPGDGPSGVRLADEPPDPQLFADALAGLPLAPSTVVRFVVTRGSSTIIIRCSAVREPTPLVALGMDVQRLRSALHAVGLLTSIVSVDFEIEADEPDTESVAIAVAAPAA